MSSRLQIDNDAGIFGDKLQQVRLDEFSAMQTNSLIYFQKKHDKVNNKKFV